MIFHAFHAFSGLAINVGPWPTISNKGQWFSWKIVSYQPGWLTIFTSENLWTIIISNKGIEVSCFLLIPDFFYWE